MPSAPISTKAAPQHGALCVLGLALLAGRALWDTAGTREAPTDEVRPAVWEPDAPGAPVPSGQAGVALERRPESPFDWGTGVGGELATGEMEVSSACLLGGEATRGAHAAGEGRAPGRTAAEGAAADDLVKAVLGALAMLGVAALHADAHELAQEYGEPERTAPPEARCRRTVVWLAHFKRQESLLRGFLIGCLVALMIAALLTLDHILAETVVSVEPDVQTVGQRTDDGALDADELAKAILAALLMLGVTAMHVDVFELHEEASIQEQSGSPSAELRAKASQRAAAPNDTKAHMQAELQNSRACLNGPLKCVGRVVQASVLLAAGVALALLVPVIPALTPVSTGTGSGVQLAIQNSLWFEEVLRPVFAALLMLGLAAMHADRFDMVYAEAAAAVRCEEPPAQRKADESEDGPEDEPSPNVPDALQAAAEDAVAPQQSVLAVFLRRSLLPCTVAGLGVLACTLAPAKSSWMDVDQPRTVAEQEMAAIASKPGAAASNRVPYRLGMYGPNASDETVKFALGGALVFGAAAFSVSARDLASEEEDGHCKED